MTQAIRVSGLNKWYGGTHALRDVSLSIETGHVHAIAGENGAGKSTLVKVLAGVLHHGSYTGEVVIDGARARLGSIRDAEAHGVFLVPQELHVVPQLTVAEYLFLNREPRRFGMVDRATLWREASRWMSIFKIDASPLALMGGLGSHEQQLVSIARAMTQGVKILILDEPTASLTERETQLLFDRVRDFKTHGVTALYISHRLPEFERIADAVTVMRDGRVVDGFPLERNGDTPRRVIKAMVGRELDELYPKRKVAAGATVFSVEDWSVGSPVFGRPPAVKPLNLSAKGGEVLGIYGLIGSGASDLARSFFGVHGGTVSGVMRVRGKVVDARQPGGAIKAGVAYMPSDRKRDGLILGMPVSANLTLAALAKMTTFGVIERRLELLSVQKYVTSLKIKCASVEAPISSLSGGNQQKVVAAKWMLAEPDVFIFEEPTRGVDVNARIEIYQLINEVAAIGKAVILISTDLPEVLGMADRVMVMHAGSVTGQWATNDIDEETAMLHASGEEVFA